VKSNMQDHALPAAPFAADPEALEAMLVALVESADDAIIVKDLDGTIRTWNPAAERMFGYRADEVAGLPITILLPPDCLGDEAHIASTVRRGERVEHFDSERVRKDGRRILVSISESPIRDGAGRIVAAAQIARDVTEVRQAGAARATLAAIVESSEDAIVGKTLNGVILTWNAGAQRTFGYAAEEVIGKSITILIPEERLDEETMVLTKVRRGERIEHFETERIRKDGRRIRISLSVSPIKQADGTIIGAAKIARDISVRHALDAERDRLLAREQEARAQAEEANRAKDMFLAVVSHELRTPLSPILAWSRMLRSGMLDAEKASQALETIERNVLAQAQLIDDLLDVSRIVAGKLRLAIRATELDAVIQAAVDVVKPAADAKGIRVETQLDPEIGTIAGDPDRLQQVVWNLLSNAIKFTPEGGRVRLILQRVDSHVEIAVIDNGQGFPPSLSEHLFARFQQADSTTTRRHGGLGLGLAIVRHIIELHGGTVRAESAGEGKGATFVVELPLVRHEGDADRGAAPEPMDEGRSPLLAGLRVLVVDDEPDSNDVVRTILASRGAEVRVAASVPQALEVMQEWVPELIVTDIAMPAQDGYALMSHLRARERWLGRIPVIALTAYTSRNDRLRLIAAGFQMHVPKPIDPVELLASVANVAESRRRS
jgi:PAS domain S-box-containing protein